MSGKFDPSTNPRIPIYGRTFTPADCQRLGPMLWHLWYLEQAGTDMSGVSDELWQELRDFHFFVRQRDVLGHFIAEHSSEEPVREGTLRGFD